MKADFKINNISYHIDFSKPLDISLSLRGDSKNPVAWYLDAPKIMPVKSGGFYWESYRGIFYKF